MGAALGELQSAPPELVDVDWDDEGNPILVWEKAEFAYQLVVDWLSSWLISR